MWLGIDIGTGGTRALLVDERGAVRAGCTALHEDMRMERPLWAEQRPENWWDAAVDAIRGVLAQAGVTGSEIQGIGLSGQMHGLVLLDAADQVIRPSLIWCDQRSQPQVDFVNAKVGRENVLRYIANPVLTGFTLPKLLWVRDNEPQNFERARKMLLPKDYVRFRLTGEFATEVSDASGTAVFDVVNRRWSLRDDGRARARSRDCCRECYESSEVTGKITAEVAELTGLGGGHAGGGRRRRSGGERGGQRHRRGGHRLLHAGHFRRGVRAHGEGGVRSRRAASTRSATRCATSGTSWASRRARGSACSGSAISSRPAIGLRRADRRGGAIARRRAGTLLAALPDGRAHAASGCHGARRLDRPHGPAHARRPDPRGDRRRVVQPARLPGHHRRTGRGGEFGARFGRRREERVLAADCWRTS